MNGEREKKLIYFTKPTFYKEKGKRTDEERNIILQKSTIEWHNNNNSNKLNKGRIIYIFRKHEYSGNNGIEQTEKENLILLV